MKSPKKLLLIVITVLTVFCFDSINFAQQRDPSRGFQAGSSYSVKGFDAVNVSNGNVVINLPLASLPAGRGTSPGAVVTLQYNSKLWDSRQTNYSNHLQQGSGDQNPTANDYFYTANRLQLSDRSGWKVLYSYRLIETNRNDLASPDPCNGGSIDEFNARWKLEMEFPDGTVRQFVPIYGATMTQGGYYNINSNGLYNYYSTQIAPQNGLCYVAGGNNQSTTSGMTYMTTDGSRLRLFVPYHPDPYQTNINWKIYSSDGSVIENAPPDNTTVTQRVTDRNGNFIEIKAAQIVDQLGRSITIDGNGVTVNGVGGESVTTQLAGSYRWIHRKYQAIVPDTTIPQGTETSAEVNNDIYTIDRVTLPSQAGGQSYLFEYYADATQQFGTNYTNGWGELKSVTLPSGAKAIYTYDTLDGNDYYASDVLERRAAHRDMTYTDSYDGTSTPRTDITYYSASGGLSYVLNPDGTGTSEQSFYSIYGTYWNSGLAFRTTNSDGSRVERVWKQNMPNYSGNPLPYPQQVPVNANAYVKTEFTTVANAANEQSLTAIKDFNYDKNGNVTKIVEYDWVNYNSIQYQYGQPLIPANAVVKRITVNEYYNQTPDADSTASSPYTYENSSAPKLKNVLKSTEVQNAAGTPVSRREFYYDDPNNRGNLTESRTWDSAKSGGNQPYSNPLSASNSISTFVEYDTYGNVIKTTDAKGVQSTITYGAITGPNGTVTGLYPTQTETASNYASLKRTSTAQYDFYTGLPVSVTDVDNNLTSATEYDALGRSLKSKAAIGTASEIWSQTEYDDVNRRVINRSDVFVKGDGKKIAVQHFDQIGRVRLSRSIENVATENPYNEADGIKVQTRYSTSNPNSYQLVSNPYRAATSAGATNEPSMGWIRSKSINTGKHAETETFSGALLPAPWGNNANSTGVVKTDIDADRTLVTDQAGKQRISRKNALGQLTDIWEITPSDTETVSVTFPNQTLSAGYQTSYQYDTLNNLTKVIQGTQPNRTFAYSSLSRLLSASNPESGTIAYQYDNNDNLTNKTDARSTNTVYAYDALNRVTGRTYSDGATLPVTYTYDNLTHAKGKLTKVTTGSTASPFSVTDYQSFDEVGRVTQSQQSTNGTTPDPMTYTYNLSGALIEQKYPSGRVVENVLDNEGDLSIVQSKKNSASGYFNYAKTFTYTAAGAVSSMQLGNNKWESTQFNSRLQPIQIGLGTVQNGTDKLKLNFDYGITTTNNGNVLSQQITVPTVGTNPGFVATQNYTYDSLNRLKQATETIPNQTGWQQTFDYDRYGNRRFNEAGTTASLAFPKNCGTAPNNTVCPNDVPIYNPTILQAKNQLNGESFDNSGNTTKDARNRKFTYDAENKQTKVETVDGNNNVIALIGEYFYDGDGKRVKKIDYIGSQPETTIFVYDASGKMVAEYSTTVVQPAEAKVNYLTTDHLGSPRINTDQNGIVIARHDYQPFGEEVARPSYGADATRQKFTSYERDAETNLDFAQARYFNSGFGRFSSPDPLAASANPIRPQSWNRYTYSYNNPLRFNDPSGMIPADYYAEDGKFLGSDGNKDDTNIYIVKGSAKDNKKTPLTPQSAVASLPNVDVVTAIGDAVTRSNNAPFTGDLTKNEKASGGFQEAGVTWKTTDGKTEITAGSNGATSDPRVPGGTATISLPSDVDGKAHVHPSGEIVSTTSSGGNSGGGTTSIGGGTTETKTANFVQKPSAVDISNALPGTNIVVGAKDKTVYFYKATGNQTGKDGCNCVAKMSLGNFLKIGRQR